MEHIEIARQSRKREWRIIRKEENMNDLLEQLKQARLEEQEAGAHLDKLLEELQLTDEWQRVQDAKTLLDSIRAKVNEADNAVRRQALDLYGLTGNKHPFDKISIVINRNLIYQESEAFDWAGKNAPTMLKLDTKKFEKHARAVLETMPLTFVEVEEVLSVRIASEL